MAVVQCLQPTDMNHIWNVANPHLVAVNGSLFDIDDAMGVMTMLSATGVFNNHIGGTNYAGMITSLAIDTVDYGMFPNLLITGAFFMPSAIWAEFRAGKFATVTELVLAGADTFHGSGGADVLKGFAGDDVFLSSAGADSFDGGSGTNTVDYSTAGPGLVVELGAPGYNKGAAAGDTYVSIQNVIGSSFADFIYGNGFGNVFLAGAGNDTMVGKQGRDTLNGGAGNDTASYDASAAGVIASLLNPSINSGEASLDSYVSVENLAGGSFHDLLYGDNFANTIEANDYPATVIIDHDRLFGMGGNDTLLGYRGNDLLVGGAGIDTLAGGGAGNDIFRFDAPLNVANRDVITDFANASGNDDSIQLENAVMTKLGAVGALNPAFFRAAASALDANDFIVYNRIDGTLSYDANASAAGGATLLATFTNKPILTAADFAVI